MPCEFVGATQGLDKTAAGIFPNPPLFAACRAPHGELGLGDIIRKQVAHVEDNRASDKPPDLMIAAGVVGDADAVLVASIVLPVEINRVEIAVYAIGCDGEA